MYKGNSEIFFEVSINLSNCSSEIFPLLISFDLILDCSARILVDNCSDDISSEKKAIEDFLPLSCNFFAALNAILVANAVFPIPGLPAIIIRSDL